MEQRTDKTKYIIKIDLEISIKRGRGFSERSELSILNSCIPPTRKNGKRIKPRDSIPSPPTHCIMARHNSTGLLWSTIFVTIVEPVVVNPDVASKRESTNEKFSSAFISGIAHNNGKTHHSIFTTITPNLNPGDCLVHHCLTAHGSNRNKSNFSRKGFTFQFKDFNSKIDIKQKKIYEKSLYKQLKEKRN